jgi:predicted ABC-type ATPase
VSEKRIIILAGPNGAGKTTFAREYLLHEAACPTFINADLIAAGLAPFEPARAAIRAGRLMLELIEQCATRGESFAFETTLASRGYARQIAVWRAAGYAVKLVFLRLPTVELATARVAERVRQGGHAVPDDVVRRRFARGAANLDYYRRLVDSWEVYDTSGREPVLLERGSAE